MRLATGLTKLGRHLDLNPEIDEGNEIGLDAEVAADGD
jgi:hypothetical protein